ncbi:cob(I)yrinic acid a,c-diamide adenosyltransferase, partial [Candidatus Micrarchaeota archaeon]|nr:cob(I)yrinic acid a,c-diamide adenosyltransferase [Candidatus Micrarchaeota archaeon]
GHGHKVVVIQFMKGRKDIGEYKIARRLHPHYEIFQFGREEFIDLKNPGREDKELAEKGLKFARETLRTKPNLLVLDELNLAVSIGLVKVEDVVKLLDDTPEDTVVVITGRQAPKELIEIADFVNEVKDIKHPFKKGVPAQEGIQY